MTAYELVHRGVFCLVTQFSLVFSKKDRLNGPTHSTVEAGTCWSKGGSGGGSLSVNATETVAGVIPN